MNVVIEVSFYIIMTTWLYIVNHPKVTPLIDEALSQLMFTGLEHDTGIICALISKSNILELRGKPIIIRVITQHSSSITGAIPGHRPHTPSFLRARGKGTCLESRECTLNLYHSPRLGGYSMKQNFNFIAQSFD